MGPPGPISLGIWGPQGGPKALIFGKYYLLDWILDSGLDWTLDSGLDSGLDSKVL